MAEVASGEIFIATSLDGFIARDDGDIRWLVDLPVPEGEDFGYAAFMEGIGVLVMGRQSFEKALTFPEWIYKVPVVVMSRAPDTVQVPDHLHGRVRVTGKGPRSLMEELAAQGVSHAYIDGGQVIRAFLAEGLIRRVILTLIPILLGQGRPLWGHGEGDIPLRMVATRHWSNGFAQVEYRV